MRNSIACRAFSPLVLPGGWVWLLVWVVACGGNGAADLSTFDSGAEVVAGGLDLQDREDSADLCMGDRGQFPKLEAEMTLPAYPWWEQEGLVVDLVHLQELADHWCATTGGLGGAPAFFFGEMPQQEVGGLCRPGPPPPVVLGHMYLSGYFGGLWFRDNADLMGGGGHPGDDGEEPDEEAARESFLALAENARQLVAWSLAGSDAEVLEHNREALLGPTGGGLMESMMDSLLTLYAYNFGFVKAILAQPPPGSESGGLVEPCPDYLYCPVAGTPLEPFADYLAVREQLEDQPTAAWKEWAAAVEESKKWAAIGEGLWQEGSVSAASWPVLVEINRIYLRVTALATLVSLRAAADAEVDSGRCALLLEAATDTWNRAYFFALMSAPERAGVMPGIRCRAVE